jgi:hypothetical protein
MGSTYVVHELPRRPRSPTGLSASSSRVRGAWLRQVYRPAIGAICPGDGATVQLAQRIGEQEQSMGKLKDAALRLGALNWGGLIAA